MNSISIFVTIAMEAIREMTLMNWARYGYQPYTDKGVKKYTSTLLVVQDQGHDGGARFWPHGDLPTPRLSRVIVTRKMDLIWAHPEIRSSLERRDPPNELYGGAVRSSVYPTRATGLTGFPELVDHSGMVACQLAVGWITQDDAAYLTSEAYVGAALAEKSMSYATFMELHGDVMRIVAEAKREIMGPD